MPKHAETRILPYSPEQMFDMVADVGRYAEFLPWVSAMRVRQNSATATLADMIVGFKGLRETFTSQVRKVRPSEITVDYLTPPEIPAQRMAVPARPDRVRGRFQRGFRVQEPHFEMLAGQVFGVALRKMIGAFGERAHVLYGAGSTGSSSSSAHSAALKPDPAPAQVAEIAAVGVDVAWVRHRARRGRRRPSRPAFSGCRHPDRRPR